MGALASISTSNKARRASERADPALAQDPPARWLDSSATIGAAVSSDYRDIYAITRNSIAYTCTCQGNATWGRECRHIKKLRALLVDAPKPVPFYCIRCGQYEALPKGTICRHCSDLADYETLCARQVDDAGADVPDATPEYHEAWGSTLGLDWVGRNRALYAQAAAQERNRQAVASHSLDGTRVVLPDDPFAGCFE